MDVSFYLVNYLQSRIKSNNTYIELYIVDNLNDNLAEIIIKDNAVNSDKKHLSTEGLSNVIEQLGGLYHQLFHKGQTTLNIELPFHKKNKPQLGQFHSLLGLMIISNPDVHIIFSYISKKGEYVLDSQKINAGFSSKELLEKETLIYMNELLEEHLNDVRDLL